MDDQWTRLESFFCEQTFDPGRRTFGVSLVPTFGLSVPLGQCHVLRVPRDRGVGRELLILISWFLVLLLLPDSKMVL